MFCEMGGGEEEGEGQEDASQDGEKEPIDHHERQVKPLVEEQHGHVLAYVVKWFWIDRAKLGNVRLRCLVKETVKPKPQRVHDGRDPDRQERDEHRVGKRERPLAAPPAKDDEDQVQERGDPQDFWGDPLPGRAYGIEDVCLSQEVECCDKQDESE